MRDYFEENDYMDEEELLGEIYLDALVETLRGMPQERMKVINPERYLNMIGTAAELRELLRDSHIEAQLKVDVNEMFNMGSVKAVLNELTVYDTRRFAEITGRADNFEIYPKTDGTIVLDLTFQSVLKTI